MTHRRVPRRGESSTPQAVRCVRRCTTRVSEPELATPPCFQTRRLPTSIVHLHLPTHSPLRSPVRGHTLFPHYPPDMCAVRLVHFPAARRDTTSLRWLNDLPSRLRHERNRCTPRQICMLARLSRGLEAPGPPCPRCGVCDHGYRSVSLIVLGVLTLRRRRARRFVEKNTLCLLVLSCLGFLWRQ